MISYSQQQRQVTDKQMLLLVLMHIPVVGFLVPWGYGTLMFAAGASVLVGLLAIAGYNLFKGQRACSVFLSICLMLFSAIMIQAQMGRIEMHFHIFGALALLIIYRDWVPIAVGAGLIAVHHLLMTALQLSGTEVAGMPLMVYNYGCSWSITFLHAAFVVFEAGILIFFALRMAADRARALEMIEIVSRFRKDKDLSGRLSFSDDASQSFNHLMDQFADLVGQVRNLSGHLATSSADLMQVSEYTRSISEDERSQMDFAAEATREMAASIRDVADHAHNASDSAGKAADAARQGVKSVHRSVQMTETTNSSLDDAMSQVNQLVAKVRSISEITLSISDISDQTNLLALNAAIESARAGEHGRGFAVVADEVRSLSQRTQAFTLEIRNTVDELTGITADVLSVIEQGKERSQEMLTAIHSAGDAIDAIEQAIEQVREMNLHIATSSEQQSAVSADINSNIQAVAAAGRSLVEGAEKARIMSEQLDEQIHKVDTVIGNYRT